jgi:hypothetical protein
VYACALGVVNQFIKLAGDFDDELGAHGGLFEQGAHHRELLRLVASFLPVHPGLTAVVDGFLVHAARWHAALASQTNAGDAQFDLQKLFEDNMLFKRNTPFETQMRALLVPVDSALHWSNESYMHIAQLLWDAVGRAARHQRIGHKGDEATYTVGSSARERGGDMGAFVDFDVIEMNTLYYICGYAVRCVLKWKPALVDRAAVTGSHEALVFSALFGSREILQHAWFARKLVANQVCECVMSVH